MGFPFVSKAKNSVTSCRLVAGFWNFKRSFTVFGVCGIRFPLRVGVAKGSTHRDLGPRSAYHGIWRGIPVGLSCGLDHCRWRLSSLNTNGLSVYRLPSLLAAGINGSLIMRRFGVTELGAILHLFMPSPSS